MSKYQTSKRQAQRNRNMLITRLKNTYLVDKHCEPRHAQAFNMAYPEFKCGSPSCIGGHLENIVNAAQGCLDSFDYAWLIEKELKLPRDVAWHLYYGGFGAGWSIDDITPTQAIEALEKAFATNPIERRAS